MIKLPAYFTGFASKSDGSASLRFATQELQPSDFAAFKEAHNAFGWLLFSQNPITEDHIPDEILEEDEKSPSERLRAVMFVYWKKQHELGRITVDFTTWRRQQMEKIIDSYKARLD